MRIATLTIMLSILSFACLSQRSSSIYYFDFGPAGSEVAPEAVLLTPDMNYTKKAGYGWRSAPESAFVNDEFSKSRDAFNIDGVEGQELDFKIDLPEGEWWITLYTDAGYEDSSTVQLEINQQLINMDWHAFQPPAEPRQELQPSYRVYQGLFEVSDAFEIKLQGNANKARLLGLSIIQNIDPAEDEKKAVVAELKELGKYPGKDSPDLAPIYQSLQNLSACNNDPHFSFWLQQVELLMRAEGHFWKRGWEKYIEIDGLSIWGQLHQAVMILDGMLNHPAASESPLYERALFLRGRILYWLGLERGGPNEIRRGAEDLANLYAIYSNDDLLAMYNGVNIDLPDPCDDLVYDDNAPAWSNMQRELLCRMRNIAHWWVLEQQAENGEFGGKIGDDVELLRWWTPVLLSGDSLAFVGWSKLADEIFKNRKIYKGYSKKPLDVEHASEFIADTAPMMVVCSDDSLYLKRLKYSVDYFQNLWTGMSVNNRRFFRSAWYSSTEVDERPPRNRDQAYNARATKAVRYYAWKTQDESTLTALNEWSDAWLSTAKRSDKGKPVGILPASVRFPDEAFNGDEENWYTANMFWKYFEWEESPGGKMLDQLMFSYTTTQDDKYLEPLLMSLDLIQKYADFEGEPEEGSEAWAAKILMNQGSFWSVAAQWRFLSGDTKYDDLLNQYGTPYLKYRLSGNEKYLAEGLERVLENARYNTPLKTYEAIHTDRVYIRGYEHLTTMLTGNASNEGLSPNFAITWENTNEDFTALVKDNSLYKIKVDMYNHSGEQQTIGMRLWQLVPGDYRLVINGASGSAQPLKIIKKGQRFALTIPPNELTTVEIIE